MVSNLTNKHKPFFNSCRYAAGESLAACAAAVIKGSPFGGGPVMGPIRDTDPGPASATPEVPSLKP